MNRSDFFVASWLFFIKPALLVLGVVLAIFFAVRVLAVDGFERFVVLAAAVLLVLYFAIKLATTILKRGLNALPAHTKKAWMRASRLLRLLLPVAVLPVVYLFWQHNPTETLILLGIVLLTEAPSLLRAANRKRKPSREVDV